MSMKPYRKVLPNGSVEDQPHRQYYIKDVTVLTDYNPMGVGEDASFMATDTMLSAGVNIVYGQTGRVSVRACFGGVLIFVRGNYLVRRI